MEQNSILKKMVDVLVSSGHSKHEAYRLINDTTYSRKHHINLSVEDTFKQESIDSLLKEYKGLQPLKSTLSELEAQPEWDKALINLRSEKQFLLSGWKVFQSIRSVSLVYLVVISAIVFLLEFFVAPSFIDVFDTFGAELPEFTKLYFSEANVAIFILACIWLFGLGYMYAIKKIRKILKTFSTVPNWLLLTPVFNKVGVIINRCILLSKLNLLDKFKSFNKENLIDELHTLGISEQDSDFKAKQELVEHYLFANELNIASAYIESTIEESFDQYVSSCTKAMRLISALGTLILSLIVASIVIAMYLPIFTMGSLI